MCPGLDQFFIWVLAILFPQYDSDTKLQATSGASNYFMAILPASRFYNSSSDGSARDSSTDLDQSRGHRKSALRHTGTSSNGAFPAQHWRGYGSGSDTESDDRMQNSRLAYQSSGAGTVGAPQPSAHKVSVRGQHSSRSGGPIAPAMVQQIGTPVRHGAVAEMAASDPTGLPPSQWPETTPVPTRGPLHTTPLAGPAGADEKLAGPPARGAWRTPADGSHMPTTTATPDHQLPSSTQAISQPNANAHTSPQLWADRATKPFAAATPAGAAAPAAAEVHIVGGGPAGMPQLSRHSNASSASRLRPLSAPSEGSVKPPHLVPRGGQAEHLGPSSHHRASAGAGAVPPPLQIPAPMLEAAGRDPRMRASQPVLMYANPHYDAPASTLDSDRARVPQPGRALRPLNGVSNLSPWQGQADQQQRQQHQQPTIQHQHHPQQEITPYPQQTTTHQSQHTHQPYTQRHSEPGFYTSSPSLVAAKPGRSSTGPLGLPQLLGHRSNSDDGGSVHSSAAAPSETSPPHILQGGGRSSRAASRSQRRRDASDSGSVHWNTQGPLLMMLGK